VSPTPAVRRGGPTFYRSNDILVYLLSYSSFGAPAEDQKTFSFGTITDNALDEAGSFQAFV